VQHEVEARGFAVLRKAVPPAAVESVLRHIHLDLVRNGLDAETLGGWLWGAHRFPHLRWDPEIVELASYLPESLREGEMCDPQILLQPPDDCGDVVLESHVDREPEWAQGRRYLRILGVPLSPAHSENGGLQVWPFGSSEPLALTVEPGDVVVMHPSLPHASGLNREGGIRYAIYFRYLEPR